MRSPLSNAGMSVPSADCHESLAGGGDVADDLGPVRAQPGEIDQIDIGALAGEPKKSSASLGCACAAAPGKPIHGCGVSAVAPVAKRRGGDHEVSDS
jgi:hypothetical protein